MINDLFQVGGLIFDRIFRKGFYMSRIYKIQFLLVFVVIFSILNHVQAQNNPIWNLPAADQWILFESGHPQPWEHKTPGIRGGKSQVTSDHANLLITATRRDSGGGLNYSSYRRFDPKPYLSDMCMRLELKFRIVSKQLPTKLNMVLRMRSRKQIKSHSLALDQATQDENGWQVMRFAFDQPDDLDATDKVGGVMVAADQPCQILVSDMAMVRYRNVSLRVVNPILQNANQLQIEGETRDPNSRVFIKLIDAKGKKQMRIVDSKQGKFSMTWDNPPLKKQAHHKLTAHIGQGSDSMDNAFDQDVFAYQTDNEHLWLRVEGKQIVTSEKSKHGKQPFIATGVGYARNVVIPAQDEAVAAFCKSQHLNTIRLPFYLRYFNNRETEPIDLDYHLRTFVDPVIAAAKRHGLYVILDSHGYFSDPVDEARARQVQKNVKRWDEQGIDDWVSRWVKVADYYKDEPYVLGYELCNEPHDIAAELVRDWYGRCQKAIRKVDKRHIILVGTNDWSHARALDKTWGGFTDTFDAPYNNTVYAFHDYPTDNHPPIVQKHIVAFRDKYNVPVMCTEFGASWWDHDETTCREFQSGLLGVFARQNVGWMVWALKKVVNNPRHPHPLPTKVTKNMPKSKQPREFDSCAYSDIWGPIARIMGSTMPEPKK